MSEIADFLLARLAEDERIAHDVHVTTPLSAFWNVGQFYGCSRPAEVHIARHDPARVLAEVEAKRRIVERVSNVKWATYAVRDEVLELLALPYADHPDYRQEWRP